MKNSIIADYFDNRCLIFLSQDQFTAVDPEDFAWLNQWNWFVIWSPGLQSYYVARNSPRDSAGKQRTVYMHCEIVKSSGDVDHINHDTLDNRRSNLRAVTHRENVENLRHKSKYGPGVQKLPGGRFRTLVGIRKKMIHVGVFDTPEEAVVARTQFLSAILCRSFTDC